MVQQGMRTAVRGANHPVVEAAARWGLAARGVIYLLVGVLALQISFGEGGEQADRGGALQELARQPLGEALVWAVGVGLAGMALWRLSEVLVGSAGPDGRKATKRLSAAARFVLYAAIAFSVLAFAAGEQGSGSSDRQSRGVTAMALGMPGGQWLVGAAGLALTGAGAWIAVRAVMRKYRKHLMTGAMSARTRRIVDLLGICGGASRGIVFAAAGAYAVRAAVKFDPDEAKGLDDTLRALADTSAGPLLLSAVAAGLGLFGLFSFAMARWRKV